MRATVIVIDSFGIGALPDADEYGDEGANTALHIAQGVPGPKWDALRRLGLGNAALLLGHTLSGCEPTDTPEGFFGAMAEKSSGKDTTTGHWELAGLVLSRPFHTFPPAAPSFPDGLIREFSRLTGRGVLGNKAASGVAIIEELGEQHLECGDLICYTSADSVFQIAAHEEIVPIDLLYRYCEMARELCNPYMVGRVIARPFIGSPGTFTRTSRRRDFSMSLPESGIMEHLQREGVTTRGVGKIGDIFNEEGISHSYHDKGNEACIARTVELLNTPAEGNEFVFVNLVDTDMIFGHRRDIAGYCDAVEKISKSIPEIVGLMHEGDLLIITADHGCDPGYRGTDHTREYVPLIVFIKGTKPSETNSLGVRSSFSDVAATVADYFGVAPYPRGDSFMRSLDRGVV